MLKHRVLCISKVTEIKVYAIYGASTEVKQKQQTSTVSDIQNSTFLQNLYTHTHSKNDSVQFMFAHLA